jgi:hypothetical protein
VFVGAYRDKKVVGDNIAFFSLRHFNGQKAPDNSKGTLFIGIWMNLSPICP